MCIIGIRSHNQNAANTEPSVSSKSPRFLVYIKCQFSCFWSVNEYWCNIWVDYPDFGVTFELFTRTLVFGAPSECCVVTCTCWSQNKKEMLGLLFLLFKNVFSSSFWNTSDMFNSDVKSFFIWASLISYYLIGWNSNIWCSSFDRQWATSQSSIDHEVWCALF